VELAVTLERLADGMIKFSGEEEMKMTDYGIEPPAPKILGMSPIKTGDEVTLKFEWMLAQRK
jgi:hypothetical protein